MLAGPLTRRVVTALAAGACVSSPSFLSPLLAAAPPAASPSSLTNEAGVYVVDKEKAANGLEDPLAEPIGAYSTISAALAVAPRGATVLVKPGSYTERLIVRQPMKLLAEPGATLSWTSDKPYEAALTIDLSGAEAAGDVIISGLKVRHFSPSIAQNYGVFVPAPTTPAASKSRVELRGCDVTSSSGSGVGVEGGDVTLTSSRIGACKNHGVLYLGRSSSGLIRDCLIENNKLNGLLLRDGASPVVEASRFVGNGQFGAALIDCRGRLREDNTFKGNAKGAVSGECDDDDDD